MFRVNQPRYRKTGVGFILRTFKSSSPKSASRVEQRLGGFSVKYFGFFEKIGDFYRKIADGLWNFQSGKLVTKPVNW